MREKVLTVDQGERAIAEARATSAFESFSTEMKFTW